jgi:hypothetical protein
MQEQAHEFAKNVAVRTLVSTSVPPLVGKKCDRALTKARFERLCPVLIGLQDAI